MAANRLYETVAAYLKPIARIFSEFPSSGKYGQSSLAARVFTRRVTACLMLDITDVRGLEPDSKWLILSIISISPDISALPLSNITP